MKKKQEIMDKIEIPRKVLQEVFGKDQLDIDVWQCEHALIVVRKNTKVLPLDPPTYIG